MKFVFSNLHFDGEIRDERDFLLRVVGDFAIVVGDRPLYTEVEFCLVEFAVALANWFSVATNDGPDFVYTSMESETEGLVRFTLFAHGVWRVSAAQQHYDERAALTTEQIKQAAAVYIGELRDALLPEIDIFDCIENQDALRVVNAWSCSQS